MQVENKDIEMAEANTSLGQHVFSFSTQDHPNREQFENVTSEQQDNSVSNNGAMPDLEKEGTILSRKQTQQSQHIFTVGQRNRSKKSTSELPPMGAGKSYPPDLVGEEEYVVEFDGADDHIQPQNWTMNVKLVVGKPMILHILRNTELQRLLFCALRHSSLLSLVVSMPLRSLQ
jgi:hypothetical protein